MSLLFSIPKECLSEIWSWLPHHEIKRLAQVCKQLSSVLDTIAKVEFRRFDDPSEIQPLLRKRTFLAAKSFMLRGHWKLHSTIDMTDSVFAALNGKQLTSLDLDCRLIPNPCENLIRGMTSLEHVCLYYKRYGEDHTLDFGAMFPNHPHLTSFSIKRANFLRAKGWECVTNLKSLELSRGGEGIFFMPQGTYFEFPESHLNNLTKLRCEFLCFEGTSTFKNLPNLVKLELMHVNVGEIFEEKPLFDLPNLVSLHWQETQQLTESTIESASHMTQLTKLFYLDSDDYFEYYYTDFNGISVMTQLKQLAYIDHGNISGMTNVEKLRLSHSAVPEIASAEKLPKLVDLSLTDTSLYEEKAFVLTTLCNMTNLTKLVFNLHLRQEQKTRPFLLDNFSKLQNLKELEIAPFESHDKPERFGETINAISSITSLRVLTVYNAAVAAVPEMAKLTQLQLLRVGGKPNFDTCQVPLKSIPVEYYTPLDADELHVDVD